MESTDGIYLLGGLIKMMLFPWPLMGCQIVLIQCGAITPADARRRPRCVGVTASREPSTRVTGPGHQRGAQGRQQGEEGDPVDAHCREQRHNRRRQVWDCMASACASACIALISRWTARNKKIN